MVKIAADPADFALEEGNSAEIDSKELAAFLRSDREMTPKMRAWLAELIDPAGSSSFVATFGHRAGGRPASVPLPYSDIVREYLDLIECDGVAPKVAFDDMVRKHKPGGRPLRRSTFRAAIATYRRAREAHAAICDEEGEARGTLQ